MQRSAVDIRKLQVCLLIVLSLFVATFTQWEHGLWVAISVAAIVGPFSTALTIQKAANRMYGTVAGLLLSAILQVYLRYEYHSVFLLGLIMAYSIGFTAHQNYRFFIMLVTATVCLNFGYMNLAFTSFEPFSFLLSRLIAVFAGIILFVVVQRGIFGAHNAEEELRDATRTAASEIQRVLGHLVKPSSSAEDVVGVATALQQKTASFDALCEAIPYALDVSSVPVQVAYKVRRLKDRVLSELVGLAGELASDSARVHSARLNLGQLLVSRYL